MTIKQLNLKKNRKGNFRRANFDAMRTELDYHTFEQPIIRNNAELGFEILKSRVNDASRKHIEKRRATINNPSWINNDVKQATQSEIFFTSMKIMFAFHVTFSH